MTEIMNRDIILSGNSNTLTKNIINATQRKFDNGSLWYKQNTNNRKEDLYWYPSLNSGLPIVEKRDRIHQTVYMYHDMVHTVLFDPLPNADKYTYMVGKMVGEVMSQIIADGLFASAVRNIFDTTYDYNRRLYINMFEALVVTQNVPLSVLADAISEYAIFDNRSPLWNLTDNSTTQMDDVNKFCIRYRQMFDADLWWNNSLWESYPKDRKYDIPEKLYYRSNTPVSLTSVSDVISHNQQLLGDLHIPENESACGKELAKYFYLPNNDERVYKHKTVSYKRRQEPRKLSEIRNFLRS